MAAVLREYSGMIVCYRPGAMHPVTDATFGTWGIDVFLSFRPMAENPSHASRAIVDSNFLKPRLHLLA